MRKYLLPENGNFYKSNLHCHTNCSDGKLSPEEVKELYKSHGYSVVAYTDHNILVHHPDLDDDGFLALSGYEFNINEVTPNKKWTRTCHLCFIAPDRNTPYVCYNSERKLSKGAEPYRDQQCYDKSKPDFELIYSPRQINAAIRAAEEHGYYVTYNHPYWSMESYPDYMSYNGMDAMEIYNHSSATGGYDEYNTHAYDDMLRAGKRIYAVAADDNHNAHAPDSKRCDSLGGITVIKAERLEYDCIFAALKNGHTYATTGPEIKALWFEDGSIHIECSDAEKITMNTGIRLARAVHAPNGGTVSSADFEIPQDSEYVRFTVTDAAGKCAYTNAYFTDELFAE